MSYYEEPYYQEAERQTYIFDIEEALYKAWNVEAIKSETYTKIIDYLVENEKAE